MMLGKAHLLAHWRGLLCAAFFAGQQWGGHMGCSESRAAGPNQGAARREAAPAAAGAADRPAVPPQQRKLERLAAQQRQEQQQRQELLYSRRPRAVTQTRPATVVVVGVSVGAAEAPATLASVQPVIVAAPLTPAGDASGAAPEGEEEEEGLT